MSEARSDFSVSMQDNVRKQFEEKNAVISIGMDYGKYHDAMGLPLTCYEQEESSLHPLRMRWQREEK